ncbi:MAG: hypothetical protein ACR2JR_10050 [Rubrobacteraceae bacterium]|jgi:hypothetical protein
MEERKQIGVKEAVRIATSALRDLYEDVEIEDLLLEEVERSGDSWNVTLGFARPFHGDELLPGLVPSQRAYKRIKIDTNTGEFLGMEIRELQSS